MPLEILTILGAAFFVIPILFLLTADVEISHLKPRALVVAVTCLGLMSLCGIGIMCEAARLSSAQAVDVVAQDSSCHDHDSRYEVARIKLDHIEWIVSSDSDPLVFAASIGLEKPCHVSFETTYVSEPYGNIRQWPLAIAQHKDGWWWLRAEVPKIAYTLGCRSCTIQEFAAKHYALVYVDHMKPEH